VEVNVTEHNRDDQRVMTDRVSVLEGECDDSHGDREENDAEPRVLRR